MTTPKLGRLDVVQARDVWPSEPRDFTPWLLNNVDVLGDLLGMDLALEEAEHAVGGFSLDLKGHDEATGETVIVENQLEGSDHIHLGQIITYAAGTDPRTIVWVTTGFRPEHRAAIDWLNQRTDDNTRFFGVVIHVVRIGDSQPAPNFELIAQPNDWEKQVKKLTAAPEVSAKSLLYREFWETALERIRTQYPTWTRARTAGDSWCNTGIGVSGVALVMVWRATLRTEFYFDSTDAGLNQSRFESLHRQRALIEEAVGEPLEWDEMSGRKGARVALKSSFTDPSDKDRWPAMVDWLVDSQVRMRAALEAAGGIA